MPKFRVRYWEWDMNNGEYIYKSDWEIVEARDEEELISRLERSLRRVAKDYESEGWDCEEFAGDDLAIICTRCEEYEEEEGEGEETTYWGEERYCDEIEIGYDYEKARNRE
jgi:hypothetical protein